MEGAEIIEGHDGDYRGGHDGGLLCSWNDDDNPWMCKVEGPYRPFDSSQREGLAVGRHQHSRRHAVFVEEVAQIIP
ncbi:hypothetical protein D3C86_2194580 [compost metagenome]